MRNFAGLGTGCTCGKSGTSMSSSGELQIMRDGELMLAGPCCDLKSSEEWR
jgi:hypothetical protein